MEWSSSEYIGWMCEEQFIKVNAIKHSSPIEKRPVPTISPNLSPIDRPTQRNIDLELAALMAQLRLDD